MNLIIWKAGLINILRRNNKLAFCSPAALIPMKNRDKRYAGSQNTRFWRPSMAANKVEKYVSVLDCQLSSSTTNKQYRST
jgi:hypothetical protein